MSSSHSAFRPPKSHLSAGERERPKSAMGYRSSAPGVSSYADEMNNTCMNAQEFDFLRRPKSALQGSRYLKHASTLLNKTVTSESFKRTRPMSAQYSSNSRNI